MSEYAINDAMAAAAESAAPAKQMLADGRVSVQEEIKFRKKKTMQMVDGKEVEVVTQRPGFPVRLAYHTQETLLEILASENNKVKDYIVALVNGELFKAAKGQADERIEARSAADLDETAFTIDKLSEESTGSSGKPDKEAFDAFCAHYIKVMPAVAGISTDGAKNAASEFSNGRFAKSAYQEQILQSLQKRLATYSAQAPDAYQHEDVVQWLQKKMVKLIDGLSGTSEY